MQKNKVEQQRSDALHNLGQTQDALEVYQKKTKDAMKRMEDKEDNLQEALSYVTKERDDLVDQLASVEISLASQEAQINRLLNDLNSEDAKVQDLETTNQELREQLELLTQQMSESEKKIMEARCVEKERDILNSELVDHRQMAQDIKALLKLLNSTNSCSPEDDSGNFSFKSWPTEALAGEGGMLAAELNFNNNGLAGCDPVCCGESSNPGLGNMVCEMRNLVTNMDCEIQRLRSDLKQRDADDKTYSNLREELKVLMDKVERGMTHNQELECQVSCLESDKKNVMCKLQETLNCVEEKNRTIQCLETRLNERTTQIVCFQEDIDEKNCRINYLEQQLHEMQKRLKGDGDKKDIDSEPLKEALARIKELEAVLLCKTKSLDELKERMSQVLRELRTVKMDSEKQIECLNLELTDSQQEVERLKEDNDSLRRKGASFSKMIEEMRRASRQKDEKMSCLSDEVEELKYSKEKMEELLKSQLEACECKVKAAQDKINELEQALVTCRNEVCCHLNKMDEIRAHYDNELEQRDACIRKLKDDLRRTMEELKCKIEDNTSLENSLTEMRNKLQEMCCQLNEAEGTIQCLNAKIQEMEKLMLKEKAAWMKASEELDRRLSQECNNLCVANNEIEVLKQNLQEKKNQNDCLQAEKTHLCQELKKTADQVACLEDRVKKMEDDNQELCRQLQQKMECIRDLENMIRIKDQELKCLTKFINELQAKKDSSEVQQRLMNEIKDLKNQLNKCREENQCKATMLCECEEAFKQCQMLCQDKDDEIQTLKCQIDSLQSKLSERISRVEELERGIENLHKDVERRMLRVDEQLKKYETDLMDRMQEISELQECVKTSQLNLNEKVEELEQQKQKVCLLSCELQSLKEKLKEAEDTRDHLNVQLTEKKTEVLELTQQLRLNREQMQKQHEDLVQCRQCLSCAQRDGDKLRRELDDATSSLEHRECEISRLNEERKNLMEKVAQISCQLEQETAIFQQQMTEIKCRAEKEMDCVKNYSCQLESTNSSVSQKLSFTQRQMVQMEKCFHQKLDNLCRDVEDLNTKLRDRDDEILCCKDTIALKDSEISRLKRRLCKTEKACAKETYNCSANNNTSINSLNDSNEGTQPKQLDVLEFGNDRNLISDWEGKLICKGDNCQDQDVEKSPGEMPFESDVNVSPSSESCTRDSLGVAKVQERLRNNQFRQMQIEKQLQSLEEGTQDCLDLDDLSHQD